MMDRVSLGNDVNGIRSQPRQEVILGEGNGAAHVYGEYGTGRAKTAEPIETAVWDGDWEGPTKSCIRWVCTVVPTGKYG